MKLFKGILAIAMVAMLFVSCEEAKKGSDAVKDSVEATTDAVKEGAEVVKEGVKATTDAVKEGAEIVKDGVKTTTDAVKEGAEVVKDAVSGDKKCAADCKKECCAKKDGKKEEEHKHKH